MGWLTAEELAWNGKGRLLSHSASTYQIPSIMQTSKRLGMITMNDTLLDLVEKKLVVFAPLRVL